MGGPGSGRHKGGGKMSRATLISKQSKRAGQKTITGGTIMAKALTTSKNYKIQKLRMKQLKRSK